MAGDFPGYKGIVAFRLFERQPGAERAHAVDGQLRLPLRAGDVHDVDVDGVADAVVGARVRCQCPHLTGRDHAFRFVADGDEDAVLVYLHDLSGYDVSPAQLLRQSLLLEELRHRWFAGVTRAHLLRHGHSESAFRQRCDSTA